MRSALAAEEKKQLLVECPEAKPFLRPLLGSEEFINGIERWCIWLADSSPNEWRKLRPIRERVEAVREFRLASRKGKTVEQAETPYLFGESVSQRRITWRYPLNQKAR